MTPKPRGKALRIRDIPPSTLARLNAGEIATATLVEQLAIDLAALVIALYPHLADRAPAHIEAAGGITRRMAAAAELILASEGAAVLPALAGHPSDTVRGWAAYAIALLPDLPLARRLDLIRPLADDPHFGVREWAWLALRPHVAGEIDEALRLLRPWVDAASPCVRRFAVESTRPCGVWCRHIPALRTEPARGLPLLAPLIAEPSRYVRDSVGNWLNDAARSAPEWVLEVCSLWRRTNDSRATAYICRRALRRLTRNG
jgi:3-methyladenine DNA glycosylase AlkC